MKDLFYEPCNALVTSPLDFEAALHKSVNTSQQHVSRSIGGGAAAFGHIAVAKYLATLRAEAAALTRRGLQPIQVAAENGHLMVVEYFRSRSEGPEKRRRRRRRRRGKEDA